MSDMQINEQWLQEALAGLQGIGPSEETVQAIQAAIDAGIISVPAATQEPTPVAPAATITTPLTKEERKEVFVEQRSAELEAANKPVNVAALEKRFDELAKTPEGREQITTVVQRAEPEILQSIVPDKVRVAEPTTEAPVAETPTAPPAVEAEKVAEVAQPVVEQPASEVPNKSDFGSGAEYAQALRQFEQEQSREAESARITQTYYNVGPQVTGAQQDYLDEIFAGYGTGKYSGADVENAMSILAGQAASGMFKGSTGNGDDTDGEDVPEITSDAKATLASVLRQYGLESLSSVVWEKYARGEFSIEDQDSILFSIKDEQAYKDRFAANAARAARGLSELTPATYLSLERTYRETMAANGLPTGFYDTKEDFQRLIEGDVSVSELNSRLRDAYSVIQDADQSVINKLRTEYGIGDGDIVAYFIDPERARPMLASADYKRQAQASIFMARAQNMAGINLQKQQAELLAQKGVTTAEAEKAFTNISQMNELRFANPNEVQLTDEEIVGAATGTDTEAMRKLEQIKSKRKAQFLGGGEYAQRQIAGGAIKSGI